MLPRFCAYGFLKNLRLFEAFLVLALLDRGLDFLAIGGLIAIRAVTTQVFEIPSGALADGLGRRACMWISLTSYVVAYLILGLVEPWWLLALGMGLIGLGDAFRSGTHKALIYAWLRREGRTAERTRIYGYTRSWSKRGSAVSALLGGALLVAGADYHWVFLGSALPALLNVVNLLGYPPELDEREERDGEGLGSAIAALRVGLAAMLGAGPLRRLARQSISVEGGYAAVKDYLQPVLLTLALGLGRPGAGELDPQARTGLVVGIASAVLFLFASAASRRAHRVEAALGDPGRGARALGAAMATAYALLLVFLWTELRVPAVLVFVALAMGQNLWRPIQVGRFDAASSPSITATVLSVESQLRSLTVAIAAPLLGAVLDATGYRPEDGSIRGLWPVAAFALALLALGLAGTARAPGDSRPGPAASGAGG